MVAGAEYLPVERHDLVHVAHELRVELALQGDRHGPQHARIDVDGSRPHQQTRLGIELGKQLGGWGGICSWLLAVARCVQDHHSLAAGRGRQSRRTSALGWARQGASPVPEPARCAGREGSSAARPQRKRAPRRGCERRPRRSRGPWGKGRRVVEPSAGEGSRWSIHAISATAGCVFPAKQAQTSRSQPSVACHIATIFNSGSRRRGIAAQPHPAKTDPPMAIGSIQRLIAASAALIFCAGISPSAGIGTAIFGPTPLGLGRRHGGGRQRSRDRALQPSIRSRRDRRQLR